MENAADALKLGFAALAFVIALWIAISLLGQANATARQVFYSMDTTTYLDPTRVGVDSTTKRRIVGLETIIPTLYRYSVENCGVTIINKHGNIIARYDVETGNVAANISTYHDVMARGGIAETPAEKAACRSYMTHIQYLTVLLAQVSGYTNLNFMRTVKEVDNEEYRYNQQIDETIQKLYKYETAVKDPYTGKIDTSAPKFTRYGAPWAATGYDSERIEADLYGENSTYAKVDVDRGVYGIDLNRYLVYDAGLLSTDKSYSLIGKKFEEIIIDNSEEKTLRIIDPNEDYIENSALVKTKKTEIIFVEVD